MHNDGIRLKPCEALVCQAKERSVLANAWESRKTLAFVLDTQQIHNISFGKSIFDIMRHAAAHLFKDSWHECRWPAKRYMGA